MSISSEIERIQSAKSDIITAIENKGVTVPTGTTIDELPELIDSIPGGGGGGWGVIPADITLTQYTRGNGGFTQISKSGLIQPNIYFEYYPITGTPAYNIMGLESANHSLYTHIVSISGRFRVGFRYDSSFASEVISYNNISTKIFGGGNEYHFFINQENLTHFTSQTNPGNTPKNYDTIILFALYNGARAICDISKMCICDNNYKCIANYISCRKNDEAGFFDLINGEFYGDDSGNNLYTSGPDL